MQHPAVAAARRIHRNTATFARSRRLLADFRVEQSDPHRFYLPRYVGSRGWVALRLDLQDVDWGEVAELVADSYRLVAPRRLADLVGQPLA